MLWLGNVIECRRQEEKRQLPLTAVMCVLKDNSIKAEIQVYECVITVTQGRRWETHLNLLQRGDSWLNDSFRYFAKREYVRSSPSYLSSRIPHSFYWLPYTGK